MTRALEDELIALLVHRLATRASAADMIDWATEALVCGEDTPSLVILAGLDRSSSVFETSPWLDKALGELRIPVLSPSELRRAVVGVVSRELLAGRITSKVALDRIHQDAVSPLGHPDDLSSWCFVWEGLSPSDYRTLTPAEIEREASRLASDWAAFPGFPTTTRTDDA
jgi:hypothetical protein